MTESKPPAAYFNEWLSLGLWLLHAALLWALLGSGWSTKENRETAGLLVALPLLVGLAACITFTAKPPFRWLFAGLTILGVGLAWWGILLLQFASGIGRGP
jgi:hypothetical protein